MNKNTLPPAPDFDTPEQAREIISYLWNKMAELEDRLNQNSNNSSLKPYRYHQVFDLPEINYTVTEHQAYQGECCLCGEKHQAFLSDTISQSQMGSNILSFIALQSAHHHQSVRKIQTMMKDVFGLYFSVGAISEAQVRLSAMLTPTHQAIHEKVKASPLIR